MPKNVDEVLARAGLKKLNKAWAKLEILGGLLIAAVGLLLSQFVLLRATEVDWLWLVSGVLLFVLGAYMALAGHRSHLYQSNNQLTAVLLEELQRSHLPGKTQ